MTQNRIWAFMSWSLKKEDIPDITFNSYKEAEDARLDLPEEIRHQLQIVPLDLSPLLWDNP